MEELSLKQMKRIAHAIGVDLFKAAMSHSLRDKKLPKEFYRNRYQDDYDTVFEELVLLGYAVKTQWQDIPYYYVTEQGIEQFKKQYKEIVNYRPRKDRDLEYLKHRIKFYCEFYDYNFADNNADEILYEDVINFFKKELANVYYNNRYYFDNLISKNEKTTKNFVGGNYLRGFYEGDFTTPEEAFSYLSKRFLIDNPSTNGRLIYLYVKDFNKYGFEQYLMRKNATLTELNSLDEEEVLKRCSRSNFRG